MLAVLDVSLVVPNVQVSTFQWKVHCVVGVVCFFLLIVGCGAIRDLFGPRLAAFEGALRYFQHSPSTFDLKPHKSRWRSNYCIVDFHNCVSFMLVISGIFDSQAMRWISCWTLWILHRACLGIWQLVLSGLPFAFWVHYYTCQGSWDDICRGTQSPFSVCHFTCWVL